MLFDTNILIWVEHGNRKAASLINSRDERFISVQTYMELLQGVRTLPRIKLIKDFLSNLGFKTLPFTENIGHRASIYIEEYTPSCGLRAGDAIIAATAVENHLVLATGNHKHFKAVKDLQLHRFEP